MHHKVVSLIFFVLIACFAVRPASAQTSLDNLFKDKVQVPTREQIKERVLQNPTIQKVISNAKFSFTTAEVTEIRDNEISIKKDDKIYTVQIDAATRWWRRYWGKSSKEELSEGDEVNVLGTWQNEEKTILKAIVLRNLSTAQSHGVFVGTITEKNKDGFVMEAVRRGRLVATVPTTATIVNRRGEALTAKDLVIGHTVRVRGLLHQSAKSITEVTHVKDFTLPIRSPEPQE